MPKGAREHRPFSNSPNAEKPGFCEDIRSYIAILNHSDKFVGVVPRVPTPYLLGQPQGDCPYNNYANHLGLLYQFFMAP